MNEKQYDELLNIKTCGIQNGLNAFHHYHRYEPTPYSGLELLFSEYEVKKTDRIVDFGCGKGRLNFYLHHSFDVTVTGVEIDLRFFQDAMKNHELYFKKFKKKKDTIYFQCCKAEEYEIHPLDNRFYFFNPFSIQIFIKVVQNILRSAEEAKREIELVLFYPSEDYIYFLDNQTTFSLKREVILPVLSDKDVSERFLIYHLES